MFQKARSNERQPVQIRTLPEMRLLWRDDNGERGRSIKGDLAAVKRIYWKLRLWTKLAIIRIGLGPCLIEFCRRCGRKQPLVWRAEDDLWRLLNDGKDGGVFCPECLDARANAMGIALIWTPTLDYIFGARASFYCSLPELLKTIEDAYQAREKTVVRDPCVATLPKFGGSWLVASRGCSTGSG